MIIKYTKEIQNRILLTSLTWITTFAVGYGHKEILLFLYLKPITEQTNSTDLYFIYTSLTEIFTAYFSMIIFTTNQLTFFYLLYHITLFLTPGLYNFEYKRVKFLAISLCCCWGFSIFILYSFLLAKSWEFFFSYQTDITNNNFNLFFEAKLSEYLSFFKKLYFLCNISNQLLLLILYYISSLTNYLNFIKNNRKYIYFLIFTIGTIISPPDVISQLTIALILISAYEILVFLLVIKKNYFNRF